MKKNYMFILLLIIIIIILVYLYFVDIPAPTIKIIEDFSIDIKWLNIFYHYL